MSRRSTPGPGAPLARAVVRVSHEASATSRLVAFLPAQRHHGAANTEPSDSQLRSPVGFQKKGFFHFFLFLSRKLKDNFYQRKICFHDHQSFCQRQVPYL